MEERLTRIEDRLIASDERHNRFEEWMKASDERHNRFEERMTAFEDTYAKHIVELRHTFRRIDENFEAINKKFEAVESAFKKIDKNFEYFNKRLDLIESKLNTVIEKVDFLQGNSTSTIEILEIGFNDIKTKIQKISVVTRYELDYPYLIKEDPNNKSSKN